MKKITISRAWFWVAVAGVLLLTIVWLGLGLVRWFDGAPEYAFHTVALYEAPHTGFALEIRARGIVRSGQDGSDSSRATVTIRPLAGRAGGAITLRLWGDRGAEIYIDGHTPLELSQSALDWSEELTPLLRSAGYSPLSTSEISETLRAVSGALRGPRTTILEGQSTSLRVVDVAFEH